MSSALSVSRPHRLGALLAGGLPLLLCAGSAAAWSEGAPGVLTDVVGLDLARPLFTLCGAIASLLPLGPLPFRLSLLSASALGVAAGALYLALNRLLTFFSPHSGIATALLSLAASWLCAGQPAVFALGRTGQPGSFLLVLGACAFERATALALDTGPAKSERATRARYGLGVCLCTLEHPWLGIAALALGMLAHPLKTLATALRGLTSTPAPASKWLFGACAVTALALGFFVLRGTSLDALDTAGQVQDHQELAAYGVWARVPARALLLLQDGSLGRLLDARAEQHARPDLDGYLLADVERADRADSIGQRTPELTPLLREWLLEGQLPVAGMQSFVAQRPLMLELDADRLRALDADALHTLAPEGLLLRASSSALTGNDLAVQAREQGRARRALGDLWDSAPLPDTSRRSTSDSGLQAWIADRLAVESSHYELLNPDEAATLRQSAALRPLPPPTEATP